MTPQEKISQIYHYLCKSYNAEYEQINCDEWVKSLFNFDVESLERGFDRLKAEHVGYMPSIAVLRNFINTPRPYENRPIKPYELDVYDNDGINHHGRPIRHHYRVCVDGTRDQVSEREIVKMPDSFKELLNNMGKESARLWAERKKTHQSKVDKGVHRQLDDERGQYGQSGQ